jgi:hypothetical protein
MVSRAKYHVKMKKLLMYMPKLTAMSPHSSNDRANGGCGGSICFSIMSYASRSSIVVVIVAAAKYKDELLGTICLRVIVSLV